MGKNIADLQQYYLQVLKAEEPVAWPVPEELLDVGQRELSGGYVQYWAYPKSSGKDPKTPPHAQLLASQTNIPKGVVLIDKVGDELELILTKDGTAYSRTISNLENLEDSLSSILEFAKLKFNMKVEDFMTTSRVDPETEKKLDDISSETEVGKAPEAEEITPEEEATNESNVTKDTNDPETFDTSDSADSFEPSPRDSFQNLATPRSRPESIFRKEATIDLDHKKRSPLPTILLFLALVLILGGTGYYFKDKVPNPFAKKEEVKIEPVTSTPTPTPEPEAKIERSEYTIRVLNGTTKTGAAGTLANSLKELGWKIEKTGNATNSAFAQTTVRVKESTEEIAKALLEDLGSEYEATVTADLKDSDPSDGEVIIGRK